MKELQFRGGPSLHMDNLKSGNHNGESNSYMERILKSDMYSEPEHLPLPDSAISAETLEARAASAR
jgi:hypothetical protein